MDAEMINRLINSFKMIIENEKTITIPDTGDKNKFELKSNNYHFFVDLNRSGHRKPKVTYQLREQNNKDYPLLRLDIVGKEHPNPPGDFPYANQEIPCPHIHIANPKYGTSIAYPLDSNYAKMALTDNDMNDLVLVLIEFLKRCNVGNIDDYRIRCQNTLF